MNKDQQEYFTFLMSLPESVFDNWLTYASTEELARADDAFNTFRFGKSDQTPDLSTAREVLKQFTLGGK